jgi:predicted nucleotidyltransferase
MKSTFKEKGTLDELVKLIVSEFDPQELWFFGSRNRGTNSPESDWDFLAIVDPDTNASVRDFIDRVERETGHGIDLFLLGREEAKTNALGGPITGQSAPDDVEDKEDFIEFHKGTKVYEK